MPQQGRSYSRCAQVHLARCSLPLQVNAPVLLPLCQPTPPARPYLCCLPPCLPPCPRDGTPHAQPTSNRLDLRMPYDRAEVLTAALNVWRLLAGYGYAEAAPSVPLPIAQHRGAPPGSGSNVIPMAGTSPACTCRTLHVRSL